MVRLLKRSRRSPVGRLAGRPASASSIAVVPARGRGRRVAGCCRGSRAGADDVAELPDDRRHDERAGEEAAAAPAAKVRASPVAAVWGRLASRHYSVKTTRVPGLTMPASFSASQLVSRTQPCDSVRPIVDGSGVPWMP